MKRVTIIKQPKKRKIGSIPKEHNFKQISLCISIRPKFSPIRLGTSLEMEWSLLKQAIASWRLKGRWAMLIKVKSCMTPTHSMIPRGWDFRSSPTNWLRREKERERDTTSKINKYLKREFWSYYDLDRIPQCLPKAHSDWFVYFHHLAHQLNPDPSK